MGKRIVYTFLAGIGIGLILSSSIHMIHDENNHSKVIVQEKKEDTFSKEEVIKNTKKEEEKLKEKEKQEQEVKKEKKEEDVKKEEYVTIHIEGNNTSEEIANILYEKELIEHKEDFKLLLDIKRSDPFEAGEILTKKGIISGGWKVDQLLGILSKKSSEVSSILYQNKWMEDQKSISFIMNTLKTKKKLVSGDKTIQRGASIIEIINILTK